MRPQPVTPQPSVEHLPLRERHRLLMAHFLGQGNILMALHYASEVAGGDEPPTPVPPVGRTGDRATGAAVDVLDELPPEWR